MSTTEEIKEIIVQVLEVESDKNIDSEESLKKIGLNSITLVNIVLEMEKKFGIEILDEDLVGSNFRTIADIERLLKKYVK